MNHQFDSVIFDLDGTLLDTLQDLTNATNHALREGGFPEHTAEDISSYVGNGIELLICRALPHEAAGDEEAYMQTLQSFKHYYAVHNNDCTAPYPGILQMLSELHAAGIKLAIVSNKNDPNVKALNKVYFSKWIDLAVGESKTVRKKPYPDTVHLVMKSLQVLPERTLYVGDSDVDIQTAQNAGVQCASVCWGFRTKDQLKAAGATTLITHPSELVRLVLGSLG